MLLHTRPPLSLNTPEFSHKRDGFSGKPSAMTPRRAAAAGAGAGVGAGAAAAVSSNGGGSGGGSSGGGGGGGVAGFPRSSESVVGRGLDMVAAAAAQVVSRDSEDAGGGGPGDGSSAVRRPVATGKAPAAALDDSHAVRDGGRGMEEG